MTVPEYYIAKRPHAGEVIDEIIEIVDRQAGKHTAQNRQGNTCGGNKPIAECKTVTELSTQLIAKVVELEPDPRNGLVPEYAKLGSRIEQQMTCDECSFVCHAAVRVINGNPNERIRFMFEDPEDPKPSKDAGTFKSSNQPVIPTSFEGHYFKLYPGQLA